MDKVIAVVVSVLIVFFFLAGISLLVAFPVKWCWNYAVVPTFGLPLINWGKAWCLMFLALVLIKSSQSSVGAS